MERIGNNSEVETFLRNPPQLVLVFDNYRGPQKENIAQTTMQVRAAVAASIFHSDLYREAERPLICSFAGNHLPYEKPGSEKVAFYLGVYDIPDDKIITRTNTITTITDIMQFHVLSNKRGLENIAIITTDDHVRRTRQEIKNHFARKKKHGKIPFISVISPSSKILDELKFPDNLDPDLKRQIETAIAIGKTDELDGGIVEKLATLVSYTPDIPKYNARFAIQQVAQRIIYPYTPEEIARIYKLTERLLAIRK